MAVGSSPYRIMLADHQSALRQGLKRILKENPDLEVIGEAGDWIELLNFLRLNKLQPHMVLLDISMPNLSGIGAARQIKGIDPGIKVLILSMHREKEYFHQAFSTGADGYLLKEDAYRELFSAIDTIRQGELYVSPLLSGKQSGER
jgi:DNA-binding NarL/FixJ family response regulator